MTFQKRLAMILAIALCAGVLYGAGRLGMTVESAEEAEPVEESLFGHRETLYLWYADETLTDYLNSMAVSYSEYQDSVRVVPVYTQGLEYLETINRASLQTEEGPDLYIVSNDSLEKAYLAGLASEIQLPEGVLFPEELLPETAVRAVTYHDRQIGYPYYFETSCLLYNKTYLEDWARAQIVSERDLALAEDAQEQADNGEVEEEISEAVEEEEITEEELAAKLEEALPETIDGILAFADVYDAPEQVEAVFKWDVSDIFYNYFVVGNYIDVGGKNGDDASSIHIYNEEAIRALRVYQNLNQFFSIDPKEISYDGVLQDFLDGKIVYTVATSDALSRLQKAKEDGEFAYEFGVSRVPDVSEELASASLSVTQCVAVNGYSAKKEMANEFAVYLTLHAADELYARTGKLPVHSGTTYADPAAAAFLLEYENSVPMPKMIETSNFWVELEIAFAKIWEGDDANDALKALSEQIMGQVLGEAYEEEYIDVPIPVEEVEETEEEGEEAQEE
ncbi:MAG: extracellular solute-binding protein [Bacteroidales bacterium]|nr:extracellular solute-binding protein [Bacteroidales bacterium]MCM1414646.1 extracellular solute-binding protein [bacterium]MCM1424671.1 extracellular solute-binding protein [bacterium]